MQIVRRLVNSRLDDFHGAIGVGSFYDIAFAGWERFKF